MNIKYRKAEKRGKSDLGWLKANFSFSFADYFDPENLGAGQLIVFNDDIIAPKRGFGFHPHKNMEIITIVNKGAITHQDTMGSTGKIRRGDVQVMSAGTGLMHSEFNLEEIESESFQIWILPNQQIVKPRYEQKDFEWQNTKDEWIELVSGINNRLDNKENSLFIYQNASIKIANFSIEDSNQIKLVNFSKQLKENILFLFLIEGQIQIEEQVLNRRDALEVYEKSEITINILQNSTVLVIEIPKMI
jgi:quercetin 2,3-dioxygenase